VTICQVRTAADASMRARSMTRSKQVEFLERVTRMLERYRIRGLVASAAHRRATIRKLHDLGFRLTGMRRCQRE